MRVAQSLLRSSEPCPRADGDFLRDGDDIAFSRLVALVRVDIASGLLLPGQIDLRMSWGRSDLGLIESV